MNLLGKLYYVYHVRPPVPEEEEPPFVTVCGSHEPFLGFSSVIGIFRRWKPAKKFAKQQAAKLGVLVYFVLALLLCGCGSYVVREFDRDAYVRNCVCMSWACAAVLEFDDGITETVNFNHPPPIWKDEHIHFKASFMPGEVLSVDEYGNTSSG